LALLELFLGFVRIGYVRSIARTIVRSIVRIVIGFVRIGKLK
jgi:hypothetical protein